MERVRSRAITRASCEVNTGCGNLSQAGPASATMPSSPPVTVNASAARRVLTAPPTRMYGSRRSSTTASQLLCAPFLKNRYQVSAANGNRAINHCGRKK